MDPHEHMMTVERMFKMATEAHDASIIPIRWPIFYEAKENPMTYISLLEEIIKLGFPQNLILNQETFGSLLPYIMTDKVHGSENEVFFYTVGTRVSTYRYGVTPGQNKDFV